MAGIEPRASPLDDRLVPETGGGLRRAQSSRKDADRRHATDEQIVPDTQWRTRHQPATTAQSATNPSLSNLTANPRESR